MNQVALALGARIEPISVDLLSKHTGQALDLVQYCGKDRGMLQLQAGRLLQYHNDGDNNNDNYISFRDKTA